MTTQAVAFDFDGVFVRDSEAVFKAEAWGEVLAAYHGRYEHHLREAQLRYGHGQPGGRVGILRYVYEALGEPASVVEALIERSARAFDDRVQARIVAAGLVPGAREMLRTLKQRGLSLYLNSGTPTAALLVSARNLNISGFFQEILGSTNSKVDNLKHIADRERVPPASIVVVGDGDSDVAAARGVGCRFVGVSHRWNRWGQAQGFPTITDVGDVVKFL